MQIKKKHIQYADCFKTYSKKKLKLKHKIEKNQTKTSEMEIIFFGQKLHLCLESLWILKRIVFRRNCVLVFFFNTTIFFELHLNIST
jgi:hypothetical protein